VQIRPSWLFAITISVCTGQMMLPLRAQIAEVPQLAASPGEDTSGQPPEPEPLPKCMARWYVDSHITKQDWLQACERAEADEPSYNVDYARCLADWDPETHMTKREWHRSCASAVKEDPGAFEERQRQR
jgi:hypothetical protein